ncbi:MAG: cation:proton antiporter [Xenococcaceae cyanobacterium]
MDLAVSPHDLLIEKDLKQFLLVLSVSLSVASIARIFSWFRQIPYTLLLVIVGLGLASLDVRLIEFSPGLILFIFLPPLLFEAAWHTKWTDIASNFVPISLYAVGGVIVSIAGVAIGLNQIAGISVQAALLIGACLAATDSASVIALFREVGAGKRLTVLMEGESLFNDGASVVAFSLILALVLENQQVEFSATLAQFLMVTGIGIGVGGLIGFCIASLIERLDSPWVELSLTLVAAYGTYLLVEEFDGSGVIGVVTAGLILGNWGSHAEDAPSTRLIMNEFWEFLAFFINSIVFLLIGDQIHYTRLISNLGTAVVAIGAVILSRAIAIYGFGWLSNRLANAQMSWQQQTVLCWGGLRGSVSIALALSIPAVLPEHRQIITIVSGVVMFTLLIQGLTTKPLLQKLGLLEDESLHQKYLELVARRDALSQILSYLLQESDRPENDLKSYHRQISAVQEQLQTFQDEIETLRTLHPQLQEFSEQQHEEKLVAIETAIYAKFVRSGLLKHSLSPIIQNGFQKRLLEEQLEKQSQIKSEVNT